PRREMLDRSIEEFLHLGKGHNLVELLPDLYLGHAENCAVQVDIFPPGQLGMEAGAHLQQACYPAVNADPSACGFGNAAENLEQRGFAGAVAPDDADPIALLDLEGHIF